VGVHDMSASSNDVEMLQPSAHRVAYMLQPSADRVAYMLQPIAHWVAQNLEIISKTLPAHQDSAHGIHDEYIR